MRESSSEPREASGITEVNLVLCKRQSSLATEYLSYEQHSGSQGSLSARQEKEATEATAVPACLQDGYGFYKGLRGISPVLPWVSGQQEWQEPYWAPTKRAWGKSASHGWGDTCLYGFGVWILWVPQILTITKKWPRQVYHPCMTGSTWGQKPFRRTQNSVSSK